MDQLFASGFLKLISYLIPSVVGVFAIRYYINDARSKFVKQDDMQRELAVRDEKIRGLEKIQELQESHLSEIRSNVSDVKNFLMGNK